jgi:hypothetical protein
MKTNFTIAGAGRIRRHAFTAALAAFASVATLGHAATFNSPVGKWDCTMGGSGQEGITVIEFFDTGSTNGRTFQGYQLLASTPKKKASSSGRTPTEKQPNIDARGLSSPSSGTNSPAGTTNTVLFGFGFIDGPWDYDSQGRVIGNFIQKVANGTTNPTINGVSFLAKVVPGKRLTLASSTPNGKVSYKGVPFSTVPDISGEWNGLKKQDKQDFVEFFKLSASIIPNVYYMSGNGPGYGYTNDVCLVSSQKKIGFDVFEISSANTNGVRRTTYGPFKSSTKKTTAKTAGRIFTDEDKASNVNFSAELQ